MGVYVVLRKTWGRSTVLQFSKVISAILQVSVCVFLVPPVHRILSFLNGTEIWHELGWGMGVSCSEQLQTLTVRCYFPQTHRNISWVTCPPRSVMIVCIMQDTNINAVISWVLKLALTRSRMPFLPKQRGRHLLALPRHFQSTSKVLPLFDTAVCCCRCWTRSAEEERSHVRKGIHNTDRPLVFSLFLWHHVLSGERTVKDPLKKPFTRGK